MFHFVCFFKGAITSVPSPVPAIVQKPTVNTVQTPATSTVPNPAVTPAQMPAPSPVQYQWTPQLMREMQNALPKMDEFNRQETTRLQRIIEAQVRFVTEILRYVGFLSNEIQDVKSKLTTQITANCITPSKNQIGCAHRASQARNYQQC